MRTIFLFIILVYSSCKEPPAPVSYSGFYISVDTAYKYRELINFYFDIEFPWIIDTIKPKKQPIDSSKYFYRRFMAERKRGIPDSLNKFKSKLYHK